MKQFFTNWFSIDEQRISALILGFVTLLVLAVVTYLSKGDISNNLLIVLQTLIVSISGVNVASSISNIYSHNLNTSSQPNIPNNTTNSHPNI